MDYFALVERASTDPVSAFREAIAAADPLAVGITAIVDSSTDGALAVQRLRVFLEHEHSREIDGNLILGILAYCGEGELTQEVDQVLKARFRDLPVAGEQSELIAIAVTEDGPPERRSYLLLWLHTGAPPAALKTACAILADRSRPHDHVARVAVQIAALAKEERAFNVLIEYAGRHLAEEVEEDEAPHDVKAALYVLNRLRDAQDEGQLIQIFQSVARAEVPVGESLDSFLGRTEMTALLRIVSEVGKEGNGAWVAREYLPALLRVRSKETALAIESDAWPAECLVAFSETSWETYDAALYEPALLAIHDRNDENLNSAVRARAQIAYEGQASGEPSRKGIARAMFRLCLEGRVSPDDENLKAIMRSLEDDELRSVLNSRGWKSPERAKLVGRLVIDADPDAFTELLASASAASAATAVALLDGGFETLGPGMDAHAAALVKASRGDQIVLDVICRRSEAAANEVYASWVTNGDLMSFRGLAATPHSEARLAQVAVQVRNYERPIDERRELLETLGPGAARVEASVGILADWAMTGKHRPADDDLVLALELLGDDLEDGSPVDKALPVVAEICQQSTRNEVRRSSYRALGRSAPTDGVVEVLLERLDNEVAGMRGEVRAALNELARKLDVAAADIETPDRGSAVQKLARISPERALPHARELLSAHRGEDRLIAAQIMGQKGDPALDVTVLRTASESEPEVSVREEMERAARRLEVGDAYDAHIRVGELVAIESRADWAQLSPADVWGRWVDVMVAGLNRLSQAEARGAWGEAIDALDELAKIVFFQAVERHGDAIRLGEKVRARVATNQEEYGSILYTQQVVSGWKWVSHFGSLHEMRTAHLAKKGETTPVPDPSESDLQFAYNLFRLGGRPFCKLLTGVE